MEWIIGCGCLSAIAWIAFMCAQLLGLNAFGTVGFIIAVWLVLGVIAYFSEAKETRNKIKENIDQPDKLENVLNILNDQEKKGLHNFIIVQLAKINDSERINLICQQCFKCRNPLLIKLIIEKSWIASQPAQVKVYTIIKHNQLNLIKNSDGEEVKYLLDSLKDKDIEIVNRAKQSLEEIKIINQHGIDYLCQEWLLKQRDKFLESIIVKHQYQAVSPLRVKILTAVKTEQLSLIDNEGEEGVKIILELFTDKDPIIADNSLKVLNNLSNQEGINYLCQQWAKNRDQLLEEIMINQGYVATFSINVKILTALKTRQLEQLSNLNLEETLILINTFDDSDKVIVNNAQKMGDFLQDFTCKSLIYFITEQWEQYERIDFDQNLLKNVFYYSDFSLRKKITEKIKISGRSDWLQVIFAERKRKNIESMTDYDWQVTVELLSKTDDDHEKWKLAQQAPPFYSQQLLKHIHSLNFINGEKFVDQHLFYLGKKVIFNLSDFISQISDFISQINDNNDNSETVTISGHTDAITSLVINREATLLVSASHDKTIKLWELPSGRLLYTLTGHTKWINSLVMNRKGTLLASASHDKTIKLWQLPSGQLLRTLTGHTDSIRSLAINRQGNLLASGSEDKIIKIWELPSKRQIYTLTGHNSGIRSLVMNREGTLLASASHDKTIKLWQLPSGQLLRTLTGHTDSIRSLVMNRQGNLLVSGSWDKTIKLWQLPSGQLLRTLTGHTDSIRSLVMNREGNLLVSGSWDRTIKLWQLYPLDRLPVSKIVNYYDYIQDTLKRNDLNEIQRNWFEFMLALVNNYRTFEIDIEDAPIIAEAGEFDIEIEG